MDWQDPVLALPKLEKGVKSATLMKDGSKLDFTINDYGLLVKVPPHAEDEFDMVIVLELQ